MTKSFGTPLFQPVSFQLAAGEGLFLAGRNGSGKTTLLDVIAGISKPDSGTVRCRARIGYVMQHGGFYDTLSCRDNLLLEAGLSGMSGKAAQASVQKASRLCGVEAFLQKPISKCSGGMRTRAAIAAALINEPGVLLLDEIFSHLDLSAQDEIKALLISLKEQGLALVVVSHQRDSYEGICEQKLTLPDSKVSPI